MPSHASVVVNHDSYQRYQRVFECVVLVVVSKEYLKQKSNIVIDRHTPFTYDTNEAILVIFDSIHHVISHRTF